MLFILNLIKKVVKAYQKAVKIVFLHVKYNNSDLLYSMNVSEVYELRRQGRVEEAYDIIREIYAADKSAYVSNAMFWTAFDVLKKRVNEHRLKEASKIFLAMDRLLRSTNDENGWMTEALKKCQKLLRREQTREELLDNGPIHLQSGVWGEELAAAYLREKGYVILERDWHSGHRDIDIIAQHNECTVFVEVKTRRSHDFGEPEIAVDSKKQKNLLRAINHYLSYRHISGPWRFDVITIIGLPGCPSPEINHIEDFTLNLSYR